MLKGTTIMLIMFTRQKTYYQKLKLRLQIDVQSLHCAPFEAFISIGHILCLPLQNNSRAKVPNRL